MEDRDLVQVQFTRELYDKMCRHGQLEAEWHICRFDLPKRWELLRRIYQEYAGEIKEAHDEHPHYGTDPYFVDWMPIFTPIEYSAWCSIRYRGLPLYPQVPVLQYFIDFANPHMKIGVECDGKDWHDPEKDRKRDLHLHEHGWKIFRVSGSECNRNWMTDYEMMLADLDQQAREEQLEHWFYDTSDGVFEALRIYYFNHYRPESDPRFDLAVRSLVRHRLVEFDL